MRLSLIISLLMTAQYLFPVSHLGEGSPSKIRRCTTGLNVNRNGLGVDWKRIVVATLLRSSRETKEIHVKDNTSRGYFTFQTAGISTPPYMHHLPLHSRSKLKRRVFVVLCVGGPLSSWLSCSCPLLYHAFRVSATIPAQDLRRVAHIVCCFDSVRI